MARIVPSVLWGRRSQSAQGLVSWVHPWQERYSGPRRRHGYLAITTGVDELLVVKVIYRSISFEG